MIAIEVKQCHWRILSWLFLLVQQLLPVLIFISGMQWKHFIFCSDMTYGCSHTWDPPSITLVAWEAKWGGNTENGWGEEVGSLGSESTRRNRLLLNKVFPGPCWTLLYKERRGNLTCNLVASCQVIWLPQEW